MKEATIPVRTLLEEALKNLRAVQQWAGTKDFDVAGEQLGFATKLIETVEIYDCGLIGGFGKGQLLDNSRGSMYMNIYHNIFARFLWLYEKYIEGGVKETAPVPLEIGGNVAEYWKRG